MRLGRTSWIILGIGILIVAAVSLYMVYRGQVSEQASLNDDLSQETATLHLLALERLSLEGELAQLESDLTELQGETGQLEAEMSQLEAELSQLEAELEQAVAQAILLLNEAKAKFFSSVESIEYDEVLFGFARDANLEVAGLAMSEPTDIDVEGVTCVTTSFTVTVRGEVADILNFVNTIVTDEAFKTAILEPFNMAVPEPLTDKEKEDIEETIRTELTAEAIEEATAEAEALLTIEDRVGFWVEAIEEVTGISIEPRTVAEITAAIKAKIENSKARGELVELLPGDLAELIEEHIARSIVSKVVAPLADKIAALLLVGEDIVGLLGEDIGGLLEEEIEGLLGELEEDIAGSLPGYIAGLLNKYIAEIEEEKRTDSIADRVGEIVEGRETEIEERIQEKVAEEIEKLEIPSEATITLNIYTYQGEGE